jgi:UDP-glucose 4-epimerase
METGRWADALNWGVCDWSEGDINLNNLRMLPAKTELEVIFHLAGGSTVGAAISNPYEDFFRTVSSTIELLEWLRLDMPNARVVVVSSAAVYGSTKRGQISVDTDCAPYSPYGHHKKIMEDLCGSYADTYGLRCRVARLFSVYGTQLKKQLLWDMCAKLVSGESTLLLGGTGRELRDWTHVSDVVIALMLIAFDEGAKEDNRLINVGTGVGTSVESVAKLVINAWSDGSPSKNKCRVAFTQASRPGDPFSLIADPTRLSGANFTWNTQLMDGVREYVDWFRRTVDA